MNVALWIVQGLLAAGFLLVGFAHAFTSREQLVKRISWAGAVSPAFMRFIGGSELLGAIGLVLPMLTGILPWLTVAAASGLAFVMLSAIAFHAARREYRYAAWNAVFLLLALFVAYGRVALAPA